MPNAILPFTLPGCVVDNVCYDETLVLVLAHTTSPCQPCPTCGLFSSRVHSRYRRYLNDLPTSDHPLQLLLLVRRFFCRVNHLPKTDLHRALARSGAAACPAHAALDPLPTRHWLCVRW
jgi:hypothetical protein